MVAAALNQNMPPKINILTSKNKFQFFFFFSIFNIANTRSLHKQNLWLNVLNWSPLILEQGRHYNCFTVSNFCKCSPSAINSNKLKKMIIKVSRIGKIIIYLVKNIILIHLLMLEMDFSNTVTLDIWHVILATWHVSHDMWHMTHGVGWTFTQNFSSLALTVWEWRGFQDFDEKGHSVNETFK